MTIIIGIFYFLLGTIIGSFLNVVALRHNTGRSLNGRSHCFSCGKTLAYHELVPVFSFIFSLGRCRSCGSKISPQYPTIELLTGILFLGIFLKFVPLISISLFSYFLLSTFHLLIMSLLVIILIYDSRHKIIPNTFVYTFIVLAFFSVFVFDIGHWSLDIGHLFAGPILFLPFFLLWFFSRGTWMGLGDGKLALGIGWLLGLEGGFTAILLSFWIGALVGLVLLFMKRKRFTMKSEIPFAPFLILGFLIVFFFDISILDFVL